MSDSYIHTFSGGTAFVGHDAVRLYTAITLRSAIKLYLKAGIRMTRGATISTLLRQAGTITGKTYRRGQGEAVMADLTTWIEAMKSALPVETDHNV